MEEKRIRVGIASLEHVHAPGLIKAFQGQSDCMVAAIAHSDFQTASQVADQFQVPKVYVSLETMLDRENLNAVICCAANSRHEEVVHLAAQKGLAVFVEKPMAATLEQARKMLFSAEAAGILLMINYPSTWNPALHYAKQLIDEGAVGKPVYFRWRAGHRGPLAHLPVEEQARSWWHQRILGGGALLDFCCYGANISYWWFGEVPIAVCGMSDRFSKTFGDAEDNAVLLVRYPSVLAVLEASWSQGGSVPSGPTVVGDEGALSVTSRDGQNGVLLSRNGKEEFLVAPPLNASLSSGAAHFLAALTGQTALHPTVSGTFNVTVQAILEAGLRSSQAGTFVNPRTL
ncbi:MAG: Gfo/Idh/MocA family oxidoreductase [Armatimonadetes bacterium]|nr:Gfo/Idh/MocA family oxidoreductase [Armatimonadota bacterium]MDW8121894.1 Gfo/Idh/MocA family oxidoreductase [Armatimonadota bacterium]